MGTQAIEPSDYGPLKPCAKVTLSYLFLRHFVTETTMVTNTEALGLQMCMVAVPVLRSLSALPSLNHPPKALTLRKGLECLLVQAVSRHIPLSPRKRATQAL